MSLTLVAVKSSLVSPTRLGLALAALRLSTATDATNTDLDEAMVSALEAFGVEPVDRLALTDADLLAIDGPFIPRFLDLAEIRVLEGLAIAVALKPRSIQFEDFKKDQGETIRWLLELLKEKTARFALRHDASPGPAAVALDCAVRDALRLRPSDPRCYPPGHPGVWLSDL